MFQSIRNFADSLRDSTCQAENRSKVPSPLQRLNRSNRFRTFARNAALSVTAVVTAGMSNLLAGDIVFTNSFVDQTGTGFGNVINVLSLQNDPSEFGSILLDSGGNDVEAGNATNQSQTRTVQELTDEGVNSSNFGIVLNINEAGPTPRDLTLNDFSFRFYTDTSDLTQFFDLTFDAPAGGLTLLEIDSGNGKSGWLFSAQFTPAEASAFFADPDNRVGAFVVSGQAITGTTDGADSFRIIAIPEPSTTAAIGLGCLLLLARGRWMHRRRV